MFVPIRVPVPISVPVTVSLFASNIPNAVPFFESVRVVPFFSIVPVRYQGTKVSTAKFSGMTEFCANAILTSLAIF